MAVRVERSRSGRDTLYALRRRRWIHGRWIRAPVPWHELQPVELVTGIDMGINDGHRLTVTVAGKATA